MRSLTIQKLKEVNAIYSGKVREMEATVEKALGRLSEKKSKSHRTIEDLIEQEEYKAKTKELNSLHS